MKLLTAVLVLSASTLAAQTTNPFFAESTLPFHAPPFDKIHDADYQPAIEEGMKQHLAEIKAIANDTAAPTFANTIEAMEKSGRLLSRVQRVFGSMSQANTNPT
ncbi:MAG TPA: dipeptidyl carboxypeptidase II, partial [Thermoanaerobaculia bacterium]|nr:dipeptidyl carboxypeptidase II [Thermoanaerobaculia bacterium]